MLIQKIKSECIYVMVLWIIITWGIMLIDIQHRWKTQHQLIENWSYNLNPSEGDGWVIAATHGGKK